MSKRESADEMIERVELMADGDAHWDLSAKDCAAIRFVLDGLASTCCERDASRSAVERLAARLAELEPDAQRWHAVADLYEAADFTWGHPAHAVVVFTLPPGVRLTMDPRSFADGVIAARAKATS